jgi:hypothetical protein
VFAEISNTFFIGVKMLKSLYDHFLHGSLYHFALKLPPVRRHFPVGYKIILIALPLVAHPVKDNVAANKVSRRKRIGIKPSAADY